ncbi:MAG TPA: radical SAM protein [Thermoanaerobaculia bacterium]|nr:radical SAM protein [Thermoanaerobaculia bacterium]
MRYFALHQDVFFETGAQSGALYDFVRRRVQPLTTAQTRILEQLERDVPVAEVEGFAAEDVEKLVGRLCDESLGARHDAVRRRDRFMPALKIDLNGLVEPPLTINVLQLELTSSCSLACTGCGTRDGAVWQGCNSCERWPGVPHDAAWTEAALDKLAAEIEPLDVRSIFFSGGDPFTEPELLLGAIRRLRQRPHPPLFFITTPGVAATPELLDRIAETGAKLNFVLLGETREEYEEVCGDASAFDAALDAIAAAQMRAIPFNITLRLAGVDPATAAQRRKWGATLGAQRVYASERLRVDDDGGVRPAAALATTGRARVPQVGPDQFFGRREKHPCLAGTMGVAADLTIRPCPMIEDRAFGHFGLEPLAAVFRQRRHEKYWNLTKEQVPGCSVCEFRYACADCAAVDLAKKRQPALHAAICEYDPARGKWAE